MKHSIFISYRSFDEPFAALLIDQWLAARFGRGQVFRDSLTIPLGTHFPDRIALALQHCRALVAVIGDRWLCLGPDGRRRIDHPEDLVRREIATALRRDILVVPVLVGEAGLPSADELPADLQPLASRQYLQLRVRSADIDGRRLVEQLTRLLGLIDTGCGRAEAPVADTHHSFDGPADAPYPVLGNAYNAR